MSKGSYRRCFLEASLHERWRLIWPKEEAPDLSGLSDDELQVSYRRLKALSFGLMYGGGVVKLTEVLDKQNNMQ
jgi:hypothetical protein